MVYRTGWLPHRGDIITRTVDHTAAAASTVRRASKPIKAGRIRPDVIVATAPAIDTIYAGNWLGRLFNIPVVTEMRDAWPDLVTYTPGLANAKGPVAVVKRRIHESITRAQLSSGQVVTTTSAFAGVLEERGVQHLEIIRNALFRASMSRCRRATRITVRCVCSTWATSGAAKVSTSSSAPLRSCGSRASTSRHASSGAGHEAPALKQLNTQLGELVEILERVPPSEVLRDYA